MSHSAFAFQFPGGEQKLGHFAEFLIEFRELIHHGGHSHDDWPSYDLYASMSANAKNNCPGFWIFLPGTQRFHQQIYQFIALFPEMASNRFEIQNKKNPTYSCAETQINSFWLLRNRCEWTQKRGYSGTEFARTHYVNTLYLVHTRIELDLTDCVE